LAPAAPAFTLPLAAERIDASAPPPKYQVQVEVYPNPVILQPVPQMQKWDASAPPPKFAVTIDQPIIRPITLNPVPAFLRLDQSAPPPKYAVQVDAYPNTLVLGINPNAAPARLDASAPPPKYAVQVDAYPNLSVSTLLSLATVPNVVGETQAQATTDITGVGLLVSVQTAYSDTVAAGVVISQVPIGGTTVASGSLVVITVSLGAQPVSPEVPAGRRQRTIYRVTIDGQVFERRSYQEIIVLLEQAKEMAAKAAKAHAERLAQAQAESAIRVQAKPLKAPEITVSTRELRSAVSEAKRDIQAIYQREFEYAELRILMELQQRQQDDDEIIQFLM